MMKGQRTAGFFLVLVAALAGSAGQALTLDDTVARLEREGAVHAEAVRAIQRQLQKTADTRFAISLTLASPDVLEVDSVEVAVDNRTLGIYRADEGGLGPVFSGHLSDGTHTLTAIINARAANKRFVRREIVHGFEKRPVPLSLLMTIEASAPDYEPRARIVSDTRPIAEPGTQSEQMSAGRPSRQQALLSQAEHARIQGRLDQAGQILASMKADYLAAVGYMNLATDFAKTDLNSSRAMIALRVALSMAAQDSDQPRRQDLLDQLNLRAGYLALQGDEFDKAMGFLEKVALDSYHAPRALYLHGLALSGKENQRAAMQSWHRARKFPLAFPGVAEAWIGMGRGYDISGYPGQAGEAWLAANVAFEGERTTLAMLVAGIREKGAYKTLVEDARGPETQWFLADSRTLAQPRLAYLLRFLEEPGAQASVRRVAQLDAIADALENHRHDLGVFSDALTRHGGQPGLQDQINTLALANRALEREISDTRGRAAEILDELALDFVMSQDQRMVHAIDRTEQQVAHLYEFLALERLAHETGSERRP
ncbi:MAG TPA: hypothetical protein VKY53_04110 [Marinobacter sp.]|nr:hypothetical protein [Marinobacter sp.]